MNKATPFRKVAVLAVGALFAGTLSACGTDDAPTATEGDGTISGTVSLLTPIFEGSSGKTLLEDELLPQFYEEYPDVEVNIDYTAYSRLNEKMTTSIASGLVPDVMIMGVGWVEGFAENGVLADLGEYGITAEGLAETTNDRVVEAGIYKDNLYAVPIMLDARMGVARMDILEEAGYDAPPSTIEELREMSIALTERDAGGQMTRAGFDLMSNDVRQVYATFLFSQGGTLFNEDNTEPAFNSPEGVEALEIMTDLINVDKVEEIGWSSTDAVVNPLINGRAAMGLAHNNLWTQAQEADPTVMEHLQPFLIPGESPSMMLGGSLATMSSRSQNPEAAAALLDFLTSEGPALAANEQRGNIPALDSLLTSDYVETNTLVQFAMENFENTGREGGPASWVEVRGLFSPALQAALLQEKTPQEALDDLAANAQSTLN